MSTRRLFAWSLALAVAIAAVGCSSSPTPPPPPPMAITFTASSPMPGPSSVTLQLVSQNANQLVVDVVATGLPDVASIFFDLVFNETVIGFSNANEGPFFRSGGSTTFLADFDMTNGLDEGRLVVSAAVLGGVSVRGDGVIATLTFRRVAAGTTGVTFERFGGLEPDGDAVGGLSFSGGTANVR